MVMPIGIEVKADKIGKFKIEPMKRIMEVPFKAAPKGALSKAQIQDDLLEVGKEYLVKLNVGRKNRREMSDMRLRWIGCYPNHYLFKDYKGIKITLNKVDYYLGEWGYEGS